MSGAAPGRQSVGKPVGEPGDTHVYDITRFSIIVTRTEAGKLKAFQNACLHRGGNW